MLTDRRRNSKDYPRRIFAGIAAVASPSGIGKALRVNIFRLVTAIKGTVSGIFSGSSCSKFGKDWFKIEGARDYCSTDFDAIRE